MSIKNKREGKKKVMNTENQKENKVDSMGNKQKYALIEGIRVGMVAFILSFCIALVLSLLVNFTILEQLSSIIQGTLSEPLHINAKSVMMITSVIMNSAVFSNGGNLHLGLIVFAFLPILSFWIATRKDNQVKKFDFQDMVIYIASAFVYALLLTGYSYITNGELMGISFQYVSWKNFLMTIIITGSIQYYIGINYNKSFSSGMKVTRMTMRTFLLFGLVTGAMTIIYLCVRSGISNAFILIVGIIGVLPNIAIYIMHTLMGASIAISSDLQNVVNFIDVDITFSALPIYIRIAAIIVFLLVIIVAVLRIEEENFVKDLLEFAVSFSFLSMMLAYCTSINLGIVKNLMDVSFGVPVLFAFLVPLGATLIIGLIVMLFRFMIKEFTGNHS